MSEKISQGPDIGRREAIKKIAVPLLAGMTVGIVGGKVSKETKEQQKFVVEIPSKDGMVQESTLSWVSKDARDFLNVNHDKIKFDKETGAIKIDGAYGILMVKGRNPEKIKEILVVTNRNGSSVYFYIMNKKVDTNGEWGDIVVVNRREDGELEYDSVVIR